MSKTDNLTAVTTAITLLRGARTLLAKAGARRTLRRVRSALRSATGAQRNASRFAAKELRA